MYELQKINVTILNDYYSVLSKALKNKQIPIILLACERAIKKDLPNAPKYVIIPMITKLRKTLLKNSHIKIVDFNTEVEAQRLFNKVYKKDLEKVRKNEYTKEFENMFYRTYELLKFEKKILYLNYEFFFNINFLREQFRLHSNTYWNWMEENKQKPTEMSTNISHNTNTTLKNQLKGLRSSYKLYNAYLIHNQEKDLDQHLINVYEEDRFMMTRSIQEINSLNYDIQKIRNIDYQTAIKSFKNIGTYLNSDKPIEKSLIVKSWLSNIANLYININPKDMKMTDLSEYIYLVSKPSTTIFGGNVVKKLYSSDKLRKAKFREIASYNNHRLMEITNNRYKIKYNKNSVKDIESFLKNIIYYIHKLSKN